MLAEAKIKWSTPDGDHMIAEMARVSNQANQGNVETEARLINYLMQHRELARRIEVIFAEAFPNTYLATQLPTPDQARIAELTSMLVKCQSQFAYYEQNHLAKRTEDGNEKAAVNASFVEEIGELLGK